MATVVVFVMGVALVLKSIVETNLTRVRNHCISRYFHFSIPIKQLYTSNKMERFSYKVGVAWLCGRMCIETFKRRAGFGYR